MLRAAAGPAIGARQFGSGPLPVELTAFDALLDGPGVRLAWTTASETNNAGFEVQQESGTQWASVGWVAGAGTTLEASSYGFVVSDLAPGVHRFRLRQVDLDGASELSPVVEVSVKGVRGLVFGRPTPTPATRSARVSLSSEVGQQVRVDLFDSRGRRVERVYEDWTAGQVATFVVIDTARLAPGLYWLRATSPTAKSTQVLHVAR
jgi:hypothetical protein